MLKFIIPVTVVTFLISKSVVSQFAPMPYCVCPPPYQNIRPICRPAPWNQREARQPPESIPQCYCEGPFYPTCDQWQQKQGNGSAPVPGSCICTAEFNPVCGLDTETNMVKTYSNLCQLQCAQRTNPNLIKAFNGECKNGCNSPPPYGQAGVDIANKTSSA